MTATVHRGKRTGLRIRADFAQASSPIQVEDGGGGWTSTPFQVADARHRPRKALALVNRWLARQSG